MTLPALWIRQNMLQSPGPVYNVNERPLTEAEIKVQLSLKKLSIPDWYLNNSSHPPKILMNDTPIDMRPPSWKEQSIKDTVSCSTPLMQIRNCTVNRNGVLETEIGRPTAQNQFYGTFKINRSSIGNRSPLSKKRSSSNKCQAREKESSKSRLFNVSRTFPRVSPSRKIQNINIVFDQPSRSSQSHTITDLDASDPEIVMSDDSLDGKELIEPSFQSPPTLSQSLMTTDLDRTEPEICMMADSLTTQTETIDRRIASPPISSDTYRVTDLDDPSSDPPETEDSSCSARLADSSDRTLNISNLDDAFESNPFEKRVQRSPNRELTYIKPWKPTRPEVRSCVTPEGKFVSAVSFKLRASSTPQGSPVSICASLATELTPRASSHRESTSGLLVSPPKSKKPPTPPRAINHRESTSGLPVSPPKSKKSPTPPRAINHRESTSGLPVSPPKSKKSPTPPRAINHRESTSGFPVSPPKPTPAPRTMSPKEPEAEEVCEACRADPSRAKSSRSPNGHTTSGFRPRSLLPAIDERPSSSPQPPSSPTSLVSLNTNRKSSELEGMIKRRTARQGKSLVEEIIEELNEKCRTSAQSTYVSPGSKNFVKKLVRALEKGKVPSPTDDEEDPTYRRFADLDDYDEDDNSDDDAKSAAASTSISYKDTDSSSAGSDSDLRSPTMKIDYNYDCNMNVEKSGNEPGTTKTATIGMVTSTPDSEENQDDSVYWIPIAKSKLPRTSSLLSMMSRLSTTNPPQQTPCVSPIRRTNGSGWGATYKPNEQQRTLRRIDETTILDSGYSDRSRVHSSESSDDTWFDETESTWTASETGSMSNFSFSLGSRLRHERQSGIQIHGRPFVI